MNQALTIPAAPVATQEAPKATPVTPVEPPKTPAVPPVVTQEATQVEPKTTEVKTPEPTKPALLTTEELGNLENDFNTNGGVFSDASYELLEKRGISRIHAHEWAMGQKAQQELTLMKAEAAVGGKEQLNTFRDWASKNMSVEERAAFNKSITTASSQGSDAVAGVIRDAYTKYQDKFAGAAPVIAGSAPAGEDPPFKSKEEMQAAFLDPKYRVSEDFRQAVARRIMKGVPQK